MAASTSVVDDEEQTDGSNKASEREEEEIEQKSAAPPRVVYHAILKEGEEEIRRPTSALAWSGLAAGLAMGFSLVTEGLLRNALPDRPWRPLIAKLGYSIGFLFVVLGRQQLFTENTLTAVLPLLKRKDLATLGNMLRLWGVVFIANLIGAGLFAYVIQRTTAFDAPVKAAFLAIGHEAMAHDFWTTLLRGIFAGWLVAMMVWLLPVAETARVWVIIIVTYLIGIASLCHIIAGAVETIYVVVAGEASWGGWLGGYAIPTLFGNILGGVSLVAALNHAQVTSGEE